jgi:hypothetical protein
VSAAAFRASDCWGLRVIAVVAAVATLAVATSLLANAASGDARGAAVVANAGVMFLGPAAATLCVSREPLRHRLAVAALSIAVNLLVFNLIWTGGKDNDTLESHVEASALVFVVSALFAVIVLAAFPARRRPGAPAT